MATYLSPLIWDDEESTPSGLRASFLVPFRYDLGERVVDTTTERKLADNKNAIA